MMIAFVSDQYWPSVSGVSVSVLAFKLRIHLFVTDYQGSAEYDARHPEIEVSRFRSYQVFPTDESRLAHRSERSSFFAELEELQPHLIHVHTEFNLGKMALDYGKKRNIPVLLTCHTIGRN